MRTFREENYGHADGLSRSPYRPRGEPGIPTGCQGGIIKQPLAAPDPNIEKKAEALLRAIVPRLKSKKLKRENRIDRKEIKLIVNDDFRNAAAESYQQEGLVYDGNFSCLISQGIDYTGRKARPRERFTQPSDLVFNFAVGSLMKACQRLGVSIEGTSLEGLTPGDDVASPKTNGSRGRG